jgi:hypothetical protein
LSVYWICCEGLSGSCHETLTSVKPSYRTRSQSRISSLAAIARRIADGRALKAPGQSSCPVARVLAMPRGFLRSRFTMRVNATTIAAIGFLTNDLSAFPACEAGDRQQTNEEAHEHRGGVVQDELLVASADGRGVDRGDD